MKVSQIILRWAGLKVQNGSKNLAIVHGRVRDDVKMKKNANKEKRQMKINITKRGSPKQVPSLGLFSF